MKVTDILTESLAPVVVRGIDNVPATFASAVNRLINNSDALVLDDGSDYSADRIILQFGGNLPRRPNQINVTSRFLNKSRQDAALSGVVDTIKTYEDNLEIAGDYIAKQKAGHKQQGQLINQEPEDKTDYIFQPLVEIINEFRVVVYYMNGEYHVSGVYKKTGSNASFQSITGAAAEPMIEIAIKATEAIEYGVGGVDVAIVAAKDGEHISESFIGKAASLGGKLAGKFNNINSLINDNHLVVLEVNRLPSMANPMIAQDLVSSFHRNKQ